MAPFSCVYYGVESDFDIVIIFACHSTLKNYLHRHILLLAYIEFASNFTTSSRFLLRQPDGEPARSDTLLFAICEYIHAYILYNSTLSSASNICNHC